MRLDSQGMWYNNRGQVRTTCGLRNSDDPTSDNLTPQETTTQPAAQVEADGASLSCTGSSVVAGESTNQLVMQTENEDE